MLIEKIARCVGFCVYRRSYLLWSLVLRTNAHKQTFSTFGRHPFRSAPVPVPPRPPHRLPSPRTPVPPCPALASTTDAYVSLCVDASEHLCRVMRGAQEINMGCVAGCRTARLYPRRCVFSAPSHRVDAASKRGRRPHARRFDVYVAHTQRTLLSPFSA